MTFTLRQPFYVAPGKQVDGYDADSTCIDGRSYRFLYEAPLHIVLVDGFRDEDAALTYRPRLLTSLYWASVDRDLGISFEPEIGRVLYPDDPEAAGRNIAAQKKSAPRRIEAAIANSHFACAYRTDTENYMSKMRVGGCSVVSGTPLAAFKASLAAGIPRLKAGVEDDSRLSTALALFSARLEEHSLNARFITLVMALEVLAETGERPPVAKDLIKECCEVLARHRKQAAPEEIASIESLEGAVRQLKRSSITSGICAVVARVLPDEEKRVREIYKLRSTLVHEGDASEREVAKAFADATRIVAAVLKSRMTHPSPS